MAGVNGGEETYVLLDGNLRHSVLAQGHSHSANRPEGIQDGGVSRHERFGRMPPPPKSLAVGWVSAGTLHRKAAGQATRQLCGTEALGLPTRPGIDGPRVGPARVEFRGLSGAEFLLSEAGSRTCALQEREKARRRVRKFQCSKGSDGDV